MATKDRTSLKNDFANGKYATGEKFADLIDSMKVVQEPVADPAASGTSLSFIDSISQDADGKITVTKKTLDLANAHELNPFKGWYKTGDTLPTDGFDGAYLYFKDTSELTGQTTIYRWNGTTYADTGTVVDTSNVQTFETGQAVNGVAIDGTGLENPATNALAKAGDVAKGLGDLVGVFKPSYIIQPGYSVNGTTGELTDSETGRYVEISVVDIEAVKFKGLKNRFQSWSSGFAFGYYDNGEWVKVSAEKWQLDTSLTVNEIIDYEREVPDGATVFRTSLYGMQDAQFDITTYGDGAIDEAVVEHIADSLITNDPKKALSAKQGVNLKNEIDKIIGVSEIDIESKATFISRYYIGKPSENYNYYHWIHSSLQNTGCYIYDISTVNSGDLKLYVQTQDDRAAQIFFLTEVVTTTVENAEADMCDTQIDVSQTGIGWIDSGSELLINIPSDCKVIYIQKSSQLNVSSRLPIKFIIEGLPYASLNELDDRIEQLENEQGAVEQASSIKYDYPIYGKDNDDFSLPATMQELIAIRKSNKLRFAGNPNVRYGVPYSSNFEYYRYVGLSVSVYTYLTAINNQYSLYHTEDINASSSSQSAWGRKYHATNPASHKFYGDVCCSLNAAIAGQPFVINNDAFEKGVAQNMLLRINEEGKVNPYLLRIGDVFNSDDDGHSFSVYNIKYDANMDVIAVRIIESTTGRKETNQAGTTQQTISGIRTHLYSLEEFVNKVKNGAMPYTHYRYKSIAKNLDYNKFCPDPTNISLQTTPQGSASYQGNTYEVGDNDTATSPVINYNNEICTFGGDKACFPVGELVVINYALTSEADISAYDRMIVYKDGVASTIMLSTAEVDTLVINATQVGHAVNLGTALDAGKYEACLANDSIESDEKTYWEVIDNSILTLDAVGNLVVDFDKPVKGYWLGTMRDNNDGSYTFLGNNNTCRVTTDSELDERKVVIGKNKLVGFTHIRLHIQGGYGMAAVVKEIPYAETDEETTENAGE